MTKAPTAIGANAGSRGAAGASQSTAAPDTSARADRLRRVYAAVTALERRDDRQPEPLAWCPKAEGPASISMNAYETEKTG